jgi:hypothetical protein
MSVIQTTLEGEGRRILKRKGSKDTKRKSVGGMAQVFEHLLSKCKALS